MWGAARDGWRRVSEFRVRAGRRARGAHLVSAARLHIEGRHQTGNDARADVAALRVVRLKAALAAIGASVGTAGFVAHVDNARLDIVAAAHAPVGRCRRLARPLPRLEPFDDVLVFLARRVCVLGGWEGCVSRTMDARVSD